MTTHDSSKPKNAHYVLVYYGFTSSNTGGEPAWFHTPEAARRFAAACGWTDAEVETTINAEPTDVLDRPDQPWRLDVSSSARQMAKIKTPARAAASRRNGRKGGRPSNFRRALETALRGEKSECLIYWDTQDPNDEGPAYRYRCESGALELEGWVDSNGPVGQADSQMHPGGYELWSYFGDDGRYLGPDKYGVRPVLVPE